MGILNRLFGRKKEHEPLPPNRESVVATRHQAEDSTNVDDLIKELRDPIRWERAAKKLGELRDPQTVIPLIQAIERWDVKGTESGYRIVIGSISTIGSSAIEPIAGLIHKCSEYEICVATDALKELVESGDIETLDQITRSERMIGFLESCRPPVTFFSPNGVYYAEVMEIMATALGKLAASGDKQVLERLPTFLRLCEAWHEPTKTIGLFLSNMLDTEGGKEAMTLLVKSGDPRLCVFIEKANLASLKPEIQNHISAAVEALRQTQAGSAKQDDEIPGLIRLAQDSSAGYDARGKAIQRLAEIGDSRAIAPLMQIYQTELHLIRLDAEDAVNKIRARSK